MNPLIQQSIDKTYKFMEEHRNNRTPENIYRRCNGCGKIVPIKNTKVIKGKNRNYRYCNECR